MKKFQSKTAAPQFNIEDLIKSHEKASDEAVKEALVMLEKQKREQQSKQIVENYGRLETATNAAVEAVRSLRAQEKGAMVVLEQLNAAKDKFLSGAAYGDGFSALVQELRAKNLYI